jgi:hypothetical protein
MQLNIVSPAFVDRAWEDGACQLGEALERCAGECTPSQLKLLLASGQKTLLCVMGEKPEGWLAVEFQQLPNVRVLHVYAIYAPGATLQECFDQLCQFAKDGGASHIQGACDAVISRLWRSRFGFNEVYRIARLKL